MTNNDLVWRKSTRCGTTTCVEVAVTPAVVHVRDGKQPDGPVLSFYRREWAAFVAGIREGAFTNHS